MFKKYFPSFLLFVVLTGLFTSNLFSQTLSVFKNSQQNLEIPITGLVAYYPFDGDALDQSGNNYNGTIHGATWATDRFGVLNKALSLDGVDDYVSLSPGVFFNGNFTFSGWTYLRYANYWSRFFDFGNGGASDNIFLALSLDVNGVVITEIFNESNSGGWIGSDSPLEWFSWVHLAYTLSGNVVKVYKNGLLWFEGVTNQTPRNVTRQNNYFGKSNWAADGYANCMIDDIRIYNRTLSQSEITNLYKEKSWPQLTIETLSNPVEGGTTSGSGVYSRGEIVTVGTTPNNDYNFKDWTENSTVVSTNPNYQFTVTGSRTLIANFEKNRFNLVLNADPTAGGTVEGSGIFDYGTSVTVKAIPGTGYNFLNWTENGNVVSENESYTFIITNDRTLVANFGIKTHTVNLQSNPADGGILTGSGIFDYGTTITVNAVPNTNYSFRNWTENGNVVSENQSYSFEVTSDRTLEANFTLKSYTISLQSNPAEGGTVSGGGSYAHGSNVVIAAVARNENGKKFRFLNWTENNAEISQNAEYSFIILADRNLVANFEDITSISDNLNIPKEFSLSQNYPNPFNNGTVIEYSIPKSCRVSIKIYDDLGREVNTLIDEEKAEGRYRVYWNAEKLPSGVYYYQIISEKFKETKKIVLLK